FDLGGRFDAGFRARSALEEHFGRLLIADELQELKLMLSELVKNAVIHGGADDNRHVILYLAVARRRIRAEVCDPGPGFDPEALPEVAPQGLGGRGLLLVDALSSSWGVSTDKCTCVWLEADREQASRVSC